VIAGQELLTLGHVLLRERHLLRAYAEARRIGLHQPATAPRRRSHRSRTG
jgi:hypothetical protein